MPFIEIIILILIFAASLWLIKLNFDAALTMLLILSVLGHKEFFSVYRWDMLPVRIFMLALALHMVFKVIKAGITKKKIIDFFSEPFILLLSIYWFVNGLSIIFSANLIASILFFSFQTTIMILGSTLYFRLKDNPKRVKSLIWTYIYIAFALTIFGFIQLAVYQTTGFIFGALWNVHGRTPRIGATFWDVNHFAALLASLLPVLGVFFLLAKDKLTRVKYFALSAPMAAMLLMTSSRSAWILAAVALLTFLFIMLIRKWGAKGIYALVLVLMLVSGGAFMEYSDRASPFRKVIKDYLHYRLDSFDSHVLLLQGSFQIAEMYPYFGGGTGGFFEQFNKTRIAPAFFGRDPISLTSGFRTPGHSIWGETLAETGGIGVFSFLMLMSFMLVPLLYVALTSKVKEKYLLSAGMVSSLVGWLVAAVFYSYKAEFFWLIFFLYFLYGLGIMGKKYDLQRIFAYFLRAEKLPYVVLALISGVVLFWGLGDTHLIPWDEAIYAKIAKNILRGGDFISLQWEIGTVWFEKPPLYMWLAALAMKLVGISEFAARLPSALFGFSTIFVVYQFAKRMFNKTSAFIAAIALITTTQYIYYSRTAMLDVSTTFFITMAMLYYYKTFTQKDKLANWLLIGLFIGLGGMIKNIVGFLPLIIIGVHELVLLSSKERRLTKALTRKYFGMGLVVSAVFLPWHLEMLRRYRGGFVNKYLIYHIIERATSSIEDKGRPFWWYLISLKVSMRIWFVALLGAFPFGVFQAFIKNSKKYMFLFIWAGVMFLFFSSAKSKLVWYVVPLYPVLSILVGRFIERAYDWLSKYRPFLGTPLAKSLFLYTLTAFSIFYLFLVKGLVYTGDLTKDKALLLEKKDELFGLELPIYVDKVEIPLIMYYSEGDFVDIGYRDLKRKLDLPFYDETIVFLTKESRYGNYAEEIEYLMLMEESGDFILGLLESQYLRDTAELHDLQSQIRGLEKNFEGRRERGELISLIELQNLSNLQTSETIWQQTIEAGLLAADDARQREK